jgi:tRNA-dihydrouridine synthase
MHPLWNSLKRPAVVLAPMADVTDPAYRRVLAKYGKPDVTWTEFVSADGLFHTREKKGMKDEENPLVRDTAFTEAERPILLQIFSSNPDMIRYASKLAGERGYDGVDINMGCPDKSIEKQGAGAAMMKNPDLVPKIVEAAREGVREAGRPDMSVSIKTRIGYNKEELDTWLPVVFRARPDAVTVHLRTRKEMSKVKAHWELAPRVVELRDTYAPEVFVMGNGDVATREEAIEKATASGLDGVMIGRGIFGNPWVFAGRTIEDLSREERLEALLLLSQYFGELTPKKSFHLLKKHVKAFITGFDGASEARHELLMAETEEQFIALLQKYKNLV